MTAGTEAKIETPDGSFRSAAPFLNKIRMTISGLSVLETWYFEGREGSQTHSPSLCGTATFHGKQIALIGSETFPPVKDSLIKIYPYDKDDLPAHTNDTWRELLKKGWSVGFIGYEEWYFKDHPPLTDGHHPACWEMTLHIERGAFERLMALHAARRDLHLSVDISLNEAWLKASDYHAWEYNRVNTLYFKRFNDRSLIANGLVTEFNMVETPVAHPKVVADVEANRARLEQIRDAAVHDYLHDAPSDAFYGRLLRAIGQAAMDHAVKEQFEPKWFEYDLIHNGLSLVRDVRFAFVRDGKSDKSEDFWNDHARPLDLIRTKKVPYIDRSSLEASVGEYLALPYRAQAMDRFLVRALIAVELYAYGDEMVNEETFGMFPNRSPLKQRHILLQYLSGNLLNAIVLGGVAGLCIWAYSAGVVGETAVFWIAAVCVALFFLLAAIATVALPFAWIGQVKARRTVYDVLSAMNTLYNEQRSDGPISAQYVYDRAKETATKGVVWPAPLLALLDDIRSRSGRY